jgi:hypothetical protein
VGTQVVLAEALEELPVTRSSPCFERRSPWRRRDDEALLRAPGCIPRPLYQGYLLLLTPYLGVEFCKRCREVRCRRAEMGNSRSTLMMQKQTAPRRAKYGLKQPLANHSEMYKTLTTNNSTHRHGGNRGLYPRQIMMECKPGV